MIDSVIEILDCLCCSVLRHKILKADSLVFLQTFWASVYCPDVTSDATNAKRAGAVVLCQGDAVTLEH